MKRSLGGSEPLPPLCQSGFQSLLDGLDDDDDLIGGGEGGGCGGGGQSSEKKRRLSADQVRALEKNFEVENKLEPERKARLAQELGLQPRQVAVWFQNRRARWKTKQLERDYGALKSRYDSLRLDYESILRDKDSLLAEVKELKAKLTAGGEESFSSIKEEPVASESENKATVEEEAALTLIYGNDGGGGGGSADSSDSSAVENSPLISSSAAGAVGFNGAVSFGVNYFQPPVMMKAEEGEFLGAAEEPCSNFFAEDQPPTLAWYCGAGWE